MISDSFVFQMIICASVYIYMYVMNFVRFQAQVFGQIVNDFYSFGPIHVTSINNINVDIHNTNTNMNNTH